jgi:hypothetical protein
MDWHGHDSTAALESLLDAGAHVRERDGDGNTAYRTAAQVNSAPTAVSAGEVSTGKYGHGQGQGQGRGHACSCISQSIVGR